MTADPDEGGQLDQREQAVRECWSGRMPELVFTPKS